jgi:hypothetical protein
MGRLAVDGAEAAAEVGRRDVGHRSHGAHVERLGVGAIHRVSGAQQAPIEIFSFAAHAPTLVEIVRWPGPGQETKRHRSATTVGVLRRGSWEASDRARHAESPSRATTSVRALIGTSG